MGYLYPDLGGDGYYDPETPCCDLCGRAQGDSPWSLPLDQPADWNGETGNHAACEEYVPSVLRTVLAKSGTIAYRPARR